MSIRLDRCYKTSQDLITRDIEGELVIVPMKEDIGSLESEMFALNETGKAIWEKLDGQTPLKQIIENLALEFGTTEEKIQEDVIEIMTTLKDRGLIFG